MVPAGAPQRSRHVDRQPSHELPVRDLADDLTDRGRQEKANNLVDLLVRAAAGESGIRHVTDGAAGTGVLVPYASLLEEARRIQGALRARGLKPGDRVIAVLERSRDFIAAFWGCTLGGYVPCPMLPLRADPARWATHLEHVGRLLGCSLVVTSDELRGELPAVGGMTVAALDELATHDPAPTTHRARGDDLALAMLTSGSTGLPKAVGLTHDNLLAALAGKTGQLKVTARDVMMNWIAFDHIAAMEGHLLPMSAGATQVHVDTGVIVDDPLRFLRLIDTHQVTITFAPNFLLGEINKALARANGMSPRLSCLRVLISGGEAVVSATARSLLDRLARFGLARSAIVPAFGMTETCAGSVFSSEFPDADAGQEFASLGYPVAGLRMRVVDAADRPQPDGLAGELQLSGPMVFTGYVNDEAANQAAFTADGWFRTGDRGSISGGRLTLVGRSKESIIVNGVSYYSQDLETMLGRLEGVEESYVVAFAIRPPGRDTEQLAVAFATSIPHSDEAAIHRLVVTVRNSVMMHWGFRPARILVLPKSELPKTSLGKIPSARLRARLEADEFADHERWLAGLIERQLGGYTPPAGETERELVEIVAEAFDADPQLVSATANLFNLGGTSLDILRLTRGIEGRFPGRRLSVAEVLQSPTIRQLAARLTRATGASAYEPLVALQSTGDKTPLFCVHPGVGEVLVFVNLAKYFVNERPFYALRARGFGPEEPYFGSLDEMVECYLDAIRSAQPKGPYALAGYSYGGVVAFELAKALEAQGERVEFVGILNLPPHIKDRMHELDFVEGAINLAFFLGLISKGQAAQLPEQLRTLPPERVLEHLIENAPPNRLAEIDLDLPKFATWVRVAQSLVAVGRDYEPSGTVRSVTVFSAIPLRGSKRDWIDNHLRKWDAFTREPNTYIDVPGEHYTMLSPQHVTTFQEILRGELQEL